MEGLLTSTVDRLASGWLSTAMERTRRDTYPEMARSGGTRVPVRSGRVREPKLPKEGQVACPYCGKFVATSPKGNVVAHKQDRYTPCVPSQEDSRRRYEQRGWRKRKANAWLE